MFTSLDFQCFFSLILKMDNTQSLCYTAIWPLLYDYIFYPIIKHGEFVTLLNNLWQTFVDLLFLQIHSEKRNLVQRDLPLTRDNAITLLTPVVALSETLTLAYDEDITLSLDVCLNYYQPNFLMTTSLLGSTGSFTHYVCDGLPCIPDSSQVICSETAPFPISTCAVGLNSKPKRVFVTIHAADGQLNTTSGTYESQVKFGASFSEFQAWCL